MVRCPSCGARLPEASRICPRHGAAPAAPPPADAVPEAPPLPDFAEYRIVRPLGSGGFGAVFEAERWADGERVAIKVARSDQPAASASLAREGTALAAVGSPTVPRLWASGRLAGGRAYLILEYIQAPTLADLMAEARGPLRPEQVSALAPAIVQLTARSHAAGYAHGDLKPENIFVGPFGPGGTLGARLFDFGLAHPLATGSSPAAEDGPPAPEEDGAGTPEYMAPEQCDGHRPLDARADVYALGVILYEMVAGAPPFWGNRADVVHSHRSRRPPLLPPAAAVAPAIEELIFRCLAKDPDRRIATALDLLRALSDALSPAAPAANRASTPRTDPAADVVGADNAPPPRAAAAPRAGAAPRSGAEEAPRVRERSSIALVFFTATGNLAGLPAVLRLVGGELAHAAGEQRAIAFGRELGENPARAAAQAAQMLVDRSLCRSAFVDLSVVKIEARQDGGRRYQGAVFRQGHQYPGRSDPRGVLLSTAAADVLPDLMVDALPGERPRFLVRSSDAAMDATSSRAQELPLVGRADVLEGLLDHARWATTVGDPTISTLVGVAGSGKTHIAAVLAQQLRSMSPAVDVLAVRAQEAFGRRGEQTTQEILRRLLGLAHVESSPPPNAGRELLADRLSPSIAKDLWPGVAVVMGWASPDHPDIRSIAAAPGALRSAAARALGELLRVRSRQAPLAVIIDDAHLADDTALDALEFAALQEARCRIWIGAIARPGFSARRPGWGGRAARRNEIVLPPLTPAASAELARRLLLPMTNVPAVVLAKLSARTEGIPLLMIELVRGLKRDGLLRKSERTDAWFLATEELENLPALPLIEWLADAETASLPPELVAHARLASVLGSEVTSQELEGVIRALERAGVAIESQLDAGVGLERLVASGLLIPHRRGRVGFRNALLRETLLRALPPQRREQIHRAAYDYYRTQIEMPEDDRLPRLALHGVRSGLGDDPAAIYLDLGARAMKRHDYLDAELFYGQAFDNLSEQAGVAKLAAAQGRGLMRFRLGRLEDALKDLAEAETRARTAGHHGTEVEILLDESMVLDWMNDFGRAAALTDRAEELYRRELTSEQRSPLLAARMAFARGRTLHRREMEAEAVSLFAQSASLTEGLGPEGYETLMQATNLLGWAYAMTGRYEESEKTFRNNIALCESAGDMFNLTVVLQNRGILSLFVKRLDRMLDDYHRMVSIARENGFSLAEMAAQKDIGEVYLMAGRFADADREARRAIEVSRRTVGDRSRATVSAELLLARLLVFQGQLDAAGALSESIRQRQRVAHADGLTECDFGPGEALMHRMVDLACREGGVVAAGADAKPEAGAYADSDADEAWGGLLAEAARITQQPQDTVEMLEVWGLTALRVRRLGVAVQQLQEAAALCAKSADVVAARVRASLALAEAQLPYRRFE